MPDVAEKLADLIQQKMGRRPKTDDTLDSLGVDSLAMAELTLDIETQFAIRVDEDVIDVISVAELVDYIERRIGDREHV